MKAILFAHGLPPGVVFSLAVAVGVAVPVAARGAPPSAAAAPFLFECPDFFELRVTGVAPNKKWVLTAANRDDGVGQFEDRNLFGNKAGDARTARLIDLENDRL